MKISQRQAGLLAREIIRQLQAKKVQKCPESIIQQLNHWAAKRDALMDEEKKTEEKRRKHDAALKNIVGKNVRAEAYWSLPNIIQKIEEKNIPSVSEIEDEIILKSMFKSEEDMQTFVNAIVKKYEKKLQSKVLQN